jgi:hypothetical protein
VLRKLLNLRDLTHLTINSEPKPSDQQLMVSLPATEGKTNKPHHCTHTSSVWLYNLLVRCIRKIPKSDYWLRHVSLTVRMEQLGSHWTDFQETGYLRVFQKPVEKIQVTLK